MDGIDVGLAQEVFNPGAKHVKEERRRLEHTRVIEGDRGTDCGPIDLDSGTVLVPSAGEGAVLPPRTREEEYPEGDTAQPEV
jgi:hypothetical protein